MEDVRRTERVAVPFHDLSSTAIELLHAELLRRQQDEEPSKPACGTTGRRGTYNVAIHVFAVFLIFALSTIACAFPVLAQRFPSLPIPRRFIFLSRHFGTGVLIATAFIHLLPTAFLSMTDPCLPRFWNEIYPQMPGLVAMLAVFLVVSIEQFFAIRGAKHEHRGTFEDTHDADHGHIYHRTEGQRQSNGHIPLRSVVIDTPTTDTPQPGANPFKDSTNEDDESGSDFEDLDALDPISADQEDSESATLNHPSRHKTQHDQPALHSNIGPDQDPQKMFLQCLLLEAGILFHSIFIGMAVSVATGTQFVVLLIAICFHQTFEGFALGARIANLIPALFSAKSPKPWLMCLAYGTTTPVGQILGLLMHRLYDPNSEVGLLMVGVTNAISSGLLLFAGLVQLVAEDFLADRSYDTLRGRRRIEANLSVLLGGLLMAFVGAFA